MPLCSLPMRSCQESDVREGQNSSARSEAFDAYPLGGYGETLQQVGGGVGEAGRATDVGGGVGQQRRREVILPKASRWPATSGRGLSGIHDGRLGAGDLGRVVEVVNR